MKTSPLICYANQLAGFYMIEASITKELKRNFLKENKKPSLTVIKGTLMQIWKSPNMFAFI